MKKIINSVKGTVDFYPEEMALRTWLYKNIREVSESFGYQEYEGPLIETLELYAAKSGEELVKEQAFVFEDRGENLIALRPELTPTLARMVAQRQYQLTYPLRWWSFGPFWRYERPQKGRSREFFQWNIDLIGVDTPEADAELIAVAAAFLSNIGLTSNEVKVLVNNRKLMEMELNELGISQEIHQDVFRLIDRRDKMSQADWEAYATDIKLSPSQLDRLQHLLQDEELWQKSSELSRVFRTLDEMGLGDYAQFAPNIIRGLDYYTGTVFECYDIERKYRAILAGGRYDNLVADVGGDPLPAVGYAMGDKVITVLLEELGRLPKTDFLYPPLILVTIFDENTLLPSYSLASEIRNFDLNVAIYPEPEKLGKQFKYADRIGAHIAVVLGPDELANEEVTVKNLANRHQVTVPRKITIKTIREMLERQTSS